MSLTHILSRPAMLAFQPRLVSTDGGMHGSSFTADCLIAPSSSTPAARPRAVACIAIAIAIIQIPGIGHG